MTETVETVDPPAPNLARLTRRLAGAVIVLALMVIGQSGYTYWSTANSNTHASSAATEAKGIAECVNTILGGRGPITTADSNAEIDLFTRIFAVLFAAPKDQSALYKALLMHARPDIAMLQNDKAVRDHTPLGKC